MPFMKEDLECPESEGCSLYDQMNHFLQEEMYVSTHITTLHRLRDICYAMTKTSRFESKQLAYDLNSTDRDEIIMEGIDLCKCLLGKLQSHSNYVS